MKKFSPFIVLLISILFSSQVSAQTFSGQISYAGSQTGNVHIVWAPAASGPSCDTVDWSTSSNVDVGPAASFPFNYGPVSVPSDGTYCAAAFIDAPPVSYPPNLTDPVGVYSLVPGSITPFNVSGDTTSIDITVTDPGTILTGAWDVTATVSIGPPVNANCSYSGIVGVWNAQPQSVMIGAGSLASSTPACASLTPVYITVFCGTSSYPALTNCTIAGDIGPYTGLSGNISGNGNHATGSFNGSTSGASYTVNWVADRQQASVNVPTMTEWGMLIFLILAGLAAVYYLKKQKTVKS